MSGTETLKTKFLLLYTTLEACQPPPKMLKNRSTIDAEREVTKGPGKTRRQIDSVDSHVLKNVPKGQPKGSKMEPKTNPKS